MKMLKIVLIGLDIQSANKGCEALAYSMMDMLDKQLGRLGIRAQVTAVLMLATGQEPRDINIWGNMDVRYIKDRKMDIHSQRSIIRAIRQSDICFDFTAGDSFSDIYGMKRFIIRTIIKVLAITFGRQFILGPQTYGPYNHPFARFIARYVLKRTKIVFSRDDESARLVKEMTGREIVTVTDVAMGLKTEIVETLPATDKIRVGLNVSGLLYSGGYTGDNEFELKVDYPQYVDRLVNRLTQDGTYEVFLFAHVLSDYNYEAIENDTRVNDILLGKYPACYTWKYSQTPMEIKGGICQMDVFVGARMHSLVAAFSTGVPTIPFAYSKKFKSLFGNLGYKYCVDGRELDTDTAVERTIQLIERREELKEAVASARERMNVLLEDFSARLNTILKATVIADER